MSGNYGNSFFPSIFVCLEIGIFTNLCGVLGCGALVIICFNYGSHLKFLGFVTLFTIMPREREGFEPCARFVMTDLVNDVVAQPISGLLRRLGGVGTEPILMHCSRITD